MFSTVIVLGQTSAAERAPIRGRRQGSTKCHNYSTLPLILFAFGAEDKLFEIQ